MTLHLPLSYPLLSPPMQPQTYPHSHTLPCSRPPLQSPSLAIYNLDFSNLPGTLLTGLDTHTNLLPNWPYTQQLYNLIDRPGLAPLSLLAPPSFQPLHPQRSVSKPSTTSRCRTKSVSSTYAARYTRVLILQVSLVPPLHTFTAQHQLTVKAGPLIQPPLRSRSPLLPPCPLRPIPSDPEEQDLQLFPRMPA